MSLAVIMNNGLYATKHARGKRKKARKLGLNQGAQTKALSEQKHRLLNGTVRKCLHEVKYDAPIRAMVSKVKVNLHDEGTYPESALLQKELELAEKAHADHRRIEADIKGGVARTMDRLTANKGSVSTVDFVRDDIKDEDGNPDPLAMKGLVVTTKGEARPDWKAEGNKKQRPLRPRRPKTKRGFR